MLFLRVEDQVNAVDLPTHVCPVARTLKSAYEEKKTVPGIVPRIKHSLQQVPPIKVYGNSVVGTCKILHLGLDQI